MPPAPVQEADRAEAISFVRSGQDVRLSVREVPGRLPHITIGQDAFREACRLRPKARIIPRDRARLIEDPGNEKAVYPGLV